MIDRSEKNNSWLNLELQSPHVIERCHNDIIIIHCFILFTDFEDCLPNALVEMFDMEFDFPPRTHCLSRW